MSAWRGFWRPRAAPTATTSRSSARCCWKACRHRRATRYISIRVRDRGLGLELMRRLVDDVDVQSGPNGTTVRLRKRLAKPAGPRAAATKVARR